jgi:hypothetical protein
MKNNLILKAGSKQLGNVGFDPQNVIFHLSLFSSISEIHHLKSGVVSEGLPLSCFQYIQTTFGVLWIRKN